MHLDDVRGPGEGMKARHHAAAGEPAEREGHAIAVVEGPWRRYDIRRRDLAEAADALEGVPDEPALPFDLPLVGKVLQLAAAAPVVKRTRGHHAVRSRFDDPLEGTDRPSRLALLDADARMVARSGARHEDHPPVR
jgi:hypothetical protein